MEMTWIGRGWSAAVSRAFVPPCPGVGRWNSLGPATHCWAGTLELLVRSESVGEVIRRVGADGYRTPDCCSRRSSRQRCLSAVSVSGACSGACSDACSCCLSVVMVVLTRFSRLLVLLTRLLVVGVGAGRQGGQGDRQQQQRAEAEPVQLPGRGETSQARALGRRTQGDGGHRCGWPAGAGGSRLRRTVSVCTAPTGSVCNQSPLPAWAAGPVRPSVRAAPSGRTPRRSVRPAPVPPP